MRTNNTILGGIIIMAGLIFLLDALDIIAVNAWGIMGKSQEPIAS